MGGQNDVGAALGMDRRHHRALESARVSSSIGRSWAV